MRPGTLYVCASPIGNLADVSFRLLSVLRGAGHILAEDTRRTRRLLAAYGLAGRVVSCHEHNEERRAAQVLRWLEAGEVVALLTDAGTPGIADPGARLVRRVADAGWPVVPVPGPSAALAALSVAGIPSSRVLFEGFLPRDRERRRARMASWTAWEGAIVFFEAPHRLHDTLRDLLAVLPGAYLVIARELTKRHEEIRRGPVAELVPRLLNETPRGEYTLVLAADDPASPEPRAPGGPGSLAASPHDAAGADGGPAKASPAISNPPAPASDGPRAGAKVPPDAGRLAAEVAARVAAGAQPSAAAREVARRYGLARSLVYRAYLTAGAAGTGVSGGPPAEVGDPARPRTVKPKGNPPEGAGRSEEARP
ncbi:MAG TPA: 16S rRNA (cytidine(1402)-2'-O)-methyltransferase [Thermaerobacter sp.]